MKYKGLKSLIGRTRTAPDMMQDSIRVAVVSCSSYQAGFFNVYGQIADRNDLDLVIHLGDYIYEYPAGGYGFNPSVGRIDSPVPELLTLSDYRIRHSWYKLDADSRRMHQHYPLIAIYDDHELANDSWKDGAQNHNPGEGSFPARQFKAHKAWLEWMPVRENNPGSEFIAYRTLPFGDLIDFIVVDTRKYRDEPKVIERDNPDYSMLGETQSDWFVNELNTSTAKWKVGVEFICTSLSALDRGISTWTPSAIYNNNPHIKWAKVKGIGYMIVDFNLARAHCDQFLVPALAPSDSQSIVSFYKTDDGANEAVSAPGPSFRSNLGPP